MGEKCSTQEINPSNLDIIVPGTDKESAMKAFRLLQKLLNIDDNPETISLTPKDIKKMREYFAPDESWNEVGQHWISRKSGDTFAEALDAELKKLNKEEENGFEYYFNPNIIIDDSFTNTGVWDPEAYTSTKSTIWNKSYYRAVSIFTRKSS